MAEETEEDRMTKGDPGGSGDTMTASPQGKGENTETGRKMREA